MVAAMNTVATGNGLLGTELADCCRPHIQYAADCSNFLPIVVESAVVLPALVVVPLVEALVRGRRSLPCRSGYWVRLDSRVLVRPSGWVAV